MSEQQPRDGLWRTFGRGAGKIASAYPRYAYRAANGDAIRAEAANIRRLWGALRAPPSQAPTLVTGQDNTIDIPLTAEVSGLSIDQVETLLALRLRRTTVEFWGCICAGGAGFSIWAAAALWVAPSYAGAWSGFVTAMLVLALGAKAFEAALNNWQVRTLRLGSAGEFLSSADSMLPSSRGAVRPR